MAASYDMGWQKRGKGHNSSTGHGAVMGLSTGKVMDYATRCKNCRFCAEVKAKGKPAKNHDCRKNHHGSSKSMESSVACELWNKAPLSNTRYTIYIGDDDSTTLCQMHEKVPYGVEKWSDITHAKRSLTTRLYNISQQSKFNDCSPLSQKVINYFAKCFSYAVAQNKGNPTQLKKSISQIVPHAFGDHSTCNSSWCRFNSNPTTYTHSDLPYGKDLYGQKLKEVLTNLFNEYCTDTVVSKLAPGANSQRNESLNSVIGTKNPKTRYYGGSESNDFRVACGVAQVNIGYGYIGSTLERLNIEPGEYCTKYASNMDKKTSAAKVRKAKKEVKYRRNQLRRQKNSKLALNEKKEGKTYESNVGLNLQLTPDNTSPDPLQINESVNEDQHQRYEKLVPMFCQKPQNEAISYDAKSSYHFIMFDTETTTTGMQAEICQLSAVDEDRQTEFSCYIMPEGNISKHATDVNQLELSTINGQKTLTHKGQPVRSTSKVNALLSFIDFIASVVNRNKNNNIKNIPILIGHNSLVFDVPILLRTSTIEFIQALKELNVHFGDSLLLAKQLLKEEHDELRLAPSGEFCRASLGSLYTTLFDESFPAHDALEDVKALQRVLFQSKLNLSAEIIISKSNVISSENALTQLHYNDSSYIRLQTFAGKLFNPSTNKGVLTKAMAKKIAGSGITYQDLVDLFKQTGKEGLVAILSLPPSTATSTKPRVTRNRRILNAIYSYFANFV